MHNTGEPIKGEVHATDASTATAVPVFKVGSLTAYTLADGEYLRIDCIEVVTASAADVHVFISSNNTPDAGETIVRGTFAANGGIAVNKCDVAGKAGDTIYVLSSVASIVDVNLKGSIHTEEGTKTRPSWRESIVPGH